jgi:hypothetical protein
VEALLGKVFWKFLTISQITSSKIPLDEGFAKAENLAASLI